MTKYDIQPLRIDEALLKNLVYDNLFDRLGHESTTLSHSLMTWQNNPPPNTVEKHPIANPAYRVINRGPCTTDSFIRAIFPLDIDTAKTLVSTLTTTLSKGNIDVNCEIFAAKLREARLEFEKEDLIEGHVYDPWYRDIGTNGQSKFKLKNSDTILMRTGSNRATNFVYWFISTTIEGKTIMLFIYDIVEVDYLNKKKTDKHYIKINPYSTEKITNYNLDTIS